MTSTKHPLIIDAITAQIESDHQLQYAFFIDPTPSV